MVNWFSRMHYVDINIDAYHFHTIISSNYATHTLYGCTCSTPYNTTQFTDPTIHCHIQVYMYVSLDVLMRLTICIYTL